MFFFLCLGRQILVFFCLQFWQVLPLQVSVPNCRAKSTNSRSIVARAVQYFETQSIFDILRWLGFVRPSNPSSKIWRWCFLFQENKSLSGDESNPMFFQCFVSSQETNFMQVWDVRLPRFGQFELKNPAIFTRRTLNRPPRKRGQRCQNQQHTPRFSNALWELSCLEMSEFSLKVAHHNLILDVFVPKNRGFISSFLRNWP